MIETASRQIFPALPPHLAQQKLLQSLGRQQRGLMNELCYGVGARSALRLGFFTAFPFAEAGYVGGYLVLNGVGRPLEFHCTTPVKPTRAQEILYGPTLKPYLFGEQMGPALLAKAKAPVQLIFVAQWESLALATAVDEPVALVLPAKKNGTSGLQLPGGRPLFESSTISAGPNPEPETGPTTVAVSLLPQREELLIGCNRLVVAQTNPDVTAKVRQLLSPWAETFDLSEPFDRIRAAIEEAVRRG